MDYKTDKETCAKSIKGVCSHCGEMVVPLETVDNSGDPTFWAGCKRCNRFEHIGTDPKVYKIAEKLVDERGFRFYGHISDKDTDTKQTKENNRMSQISGACGIVRDVLFYS